MKQPLLLLLSLLLACITHGAEQKPNIILILADDLGYGELGCFGQKLIATPNLDRMAAEGVKLTQFYAGSPVCAPSRSVLMTGLHTGHTTVRGNAGKKNSAAQSLRPEDTTVAELLKKAGYTTALIGKWGLGTEGGNATPNKKGFDYFYGYLDQTHAHNPYPEFILRNEERVKLRNHTIPGSGGQNDGAGVAEDPRDYVPDLMAAEALSWVEQQREKPFFLFWSLVTPHANNEGTKVGRGQEVPDLGSYGDKDWPKADKGHAAVVSRLDADCGRMFALLKKLGIDDNTLVIFSSDNGHHKEGGNDPEFFDANGPLNGMKRNLTEGGIREPTIVRWPGHLQAGTESKQVGWFADFLPTLADFAGIHAPANLDGISLRDEIGKGILSPRPLLYWEFHEGGFSQAVLLDGRWKAIRLKRRDAPIAIYDIASDLGETKDLAAEQTDLVAKAKGLFESERVATEAWPGVDAPIKR